jgi:hypothetical protein
MTSIFLFLAKSIGVKESVPQSTVKIKFTPKLINFKKAFSLGPKPSLFLSGIWISKGMSKNSKY